jgi:DNA-3-methyladenine glycosylase
LERDVVHAEKSVTGAGNILPRSFYRRETSLVARELLGKILVKADTAGIIIETEAYPGGDDLASHSAAGITKRTKVIFGPPGHAYVYFSYGMHTCMNVVVGPEGTPGAVLIRALEPMAGLEIMRQRRHTVRRDRDLASGPGKLTQALAITMEDYGADLTRGELVIRAPAKPAAVLIDVTPRIGISKCVDLPLRFVVMGSANRT